MEAATYLFAEIERRRLLAPETLTWLAVRQARNSHCGRW